MKTPQLKNWLIHKTYEGNYTLFGEIHNDSHYNENTTEFADGHRIFTTNIIKIVDNLHHSFYISTKNITYYCKLEDAYDSAIHCIYDVMKEVNK